MDADRRLFDLSEFWLISAPGERTCQQTWDVMNSVTSKQANLSTNFKFHIPDLKVYLVLFCHACLDYIVFSAQHAWCSYRLGNISLLNTDVSQMHDWPWTSSFFY